MGYVGNQTTNSYTSLDKQTITGDGGASYTLDHAVANENEIEVFVNNVRQEPSVAYTVSDTALTMTGNVESSDDFYVVFQGKAIQTVVPPDLTVDTAKIKDSAVTTAKIADDAVTTAKTDFYSTGTWTPTVSTATSVDSTSAGHGAHYTKIGNLVTFQVYMVWTNTTNNNSSLFEIGGLPFNSISDYGSFNIGYVGGANMNDAVGVVNIDTNKLYFHQNDGTASSLTNADIHTRGLTTIIITGSYFTNE